MDRTSLLEHLKKIKNNAFSKESVKRDVRTYKPFPQKIRKGASHFRTLVATIPPALFLSILPMPAIPKTFDNFPSEVKEMNFKTNVDMIVQARAQGLQQQIMSNIDSLQQKITYAKSNGTKERVIRSIFNKVYPKGGLSGNMNYCVAGAMYAQSLCHDEVLQQILPDANKTPRDYQYSSHPNVSCPYMRSFFKEHMPQNYAERGDANFKEIINGLEAGDIITVSSSVNTSSGEHCVTCAGPIKDGKIPVKSFNGERNYEVPASKIVGAACIVKQYRQDLSKKLYNERSKDICTVLNNVDTPKIDTAKPALNVTSTIYKNNQRG